MDVIQVSSLSAHLLDDHAADLDGVGAGAVGVRADLDEAVVQREAPADVRREDVGAVPQEGDLQVEALVGAVGGAVDRDSIHHGLKKFFRKTNWISTDFFLL